METAYSLSDIAAAMNDGGGFGGNSAWVLIILFALIFGWGGNGFGGNNNTQAIANDEILAGQRFDALSRQINQVGDGLSSLGYAQTNQINNESRNIISAVNTGFGNLQNCCCDLKYDIATQFANTNANTTAQTQKILDALAQNKIDELQAQVSELKTQNMFCGIPRISNYAYGVYPYSTNGCGYNSI